MAQAKKDTRIGVIADTHGLFDPVIRRHFRGVDHILHAGDIGDRFVIEHLEQIAPVTAASGNVDDDEQSVFPSEAAIEMAGHRIAIRHILYEGGKLTKEGRAFLNRDRLDICVFGHTHQPKIEWFCKTLLFKPDSVGPQRFNFLRAGRTLEVIDGKIKPMRIQQFENVVDNRILGLGEEIRYGEHGFRNAARGFLRRNRLSCKFLFIVITSQLKLWELELFLPQQLPPSLPPRF